MKYLSKLLNSSHSISYTAMKMYIQEGPRAFMEYMEDRREYKSNKYDKLGTITHERILTPEIFKSKYNFGTLDHIYENHKIGKLTPNEKKILEFVLSQFKIGKKSLFEFKLTKNLKNVFYSFYAASKKYNSIRMLSIYNLACEIYDIKADELTDPIFNNCSFSIQKEINNHKLANKIFNFRSKKNVDVFEEFEIKLNCTEIEDLEDLKLKCIIDKMIVDYDNKTIVICDLKTSIKSPKEFDSIIKDRMYAHQIALYSIAAKKYLEIEGVELSEWKIINYICLASHNFKDCKYIEMYELSESDINYCLSEINNFFEDLKINCTYGFDQTADYYKGDGSKKITLYGKERQG